jgi:hypothetical protein
MDLDVDRDVAFPFPFPLLFSLRGSYDLDGVE